MRNNYLILVMLLSTLVVLSIVSSLTIPLYAQENMTESQNLNNTFEIGDVIYDGQGKITGTKVLNADDMKIEHSAISIGKFNGINVTEIETFWAIPVGDNQHYGEIQGIITTNEGGKNASFKGYGMGYLDDSGITKIRGVNFYESSSQELLFLNNMIGLFESELDKSGNTHKMVWEWK